MSNKHIIDMITTSIEGQFFDRKSARKAPDDIVRHLVAFANASGGDLAIGVEDDGSISGFHYPGAKKAEDFTNAAHRHLRHMPVFYQTEEVPVINTHGEKDMVLLFHIPSSSRQVITSSDGEAYLRSGDQTLKLTYEQRRSLEYDRGQRFFEDEVVEGSSLEDVDEELIRHYKQVMDVAHRPTKEVLEARNLLKQGLLTNAGVMLFAKNPSKYIPNARIKFLRYEGVKSETGRDFNVVKEVTIEGPVHKMIEKARETIRLQLRDFQYLNSVTGKFQIMPEYPEFAWLEGIVNAVTHRDYALRGDYIRVSMFDDRLVIFSPGKLPNIVTVENMVNTRYSRNPRIARVLSELGWVKELNEGVTRIYSEMERAFLGTPKYTEPNASSVQLVLENNILNRVVRLTDKLQELVNSDVFSSLNEDEKAILQVTFMTGRVTVKEAVKGTGRSRFYASTLLKRLTEINLLVWHGTSQNDPTQYYTFNQ